MSGGVKVVSGGVKMVSEGSGDGELEEWMVVSWEE